MQQPEHVLMNVAGAILDGGSVDWAIADSSASEQERQLLEELRLLCSVADLHRHCSSTEGDGELAGPGQQYWGRLRLTERVGGGAFGDVYRAWDPRLDREVALKLIPLGADPRDRHPSTILSEARLLARVRHPAVVTLYDAERIDGHVGLSMEFVAGETLQQHVKRAGPFGAQEVLQIGLQLCDALSAAHGAGVLHRDVKASNVVVKPDGGVVLMDFGAGKRLDGSGTHLTGTPLYLAPEVLNGQPATVRSDVNSLGVLLYFLLTGTYPVPGHSLSELRQVHRRRLQSPTVVVAHPAIPSELAAAIGRAIDPRAERRFASAAAFARELQASRSRGGRMRGFAALAALAAVVMMLVSSTVLARRAVPASVRFAVLPFAVADDVPDSQFVREALTRGLITRLERHDNARVISSTSVVPAGVVNLPLSEMGERWGVPVALTGTVRRSRNMVDAEVHVVRTSDGRAVWSRLYSRPLAEVLEIPDAIAIDLAKRLRLRRETEHRPGKPSLDAYALFVRGQLELDKFSIAGARAALKLFDQALALEPGYAQAHASVALAYLTGYPSIPHVTREEALRRAESAVAHAIAIDDSIPEAHLALAAIKSAHGDPEGADAEYRVAVTLGPSNVMVHQLYAHWLSLHARFAEALDHAREAQALSPLSPRATLAVASVLRFAGQWEASLIETHKALEMDPNFGAAYSNLGHNYQGLGRIEEAIEAFRRWRNPSGNLGNALAQAGRVDEARAMIRQIERQFAETGVGAGDIAQIYCGLGEIDRAFEWLDRDTAAGWPTTFKVALVWAPLRSDPRYTALLQKYGVAD